MGGDTGRSRKHTAEVPKTGVNGGPVAVEGVSGKDVGVDQLLRFEGKRGPPRDGEDAVRNLGRVLLGEDLHDGLIGSDGDSLATDQPAFGGGVGEHPSDGSEGVFSTVEAGVGVTIVNKVFD